MARRGTTQYWLIAVTGLALLVHDPPGTWAQCATSNSFTGSLITSNTFGCVPLRVKASSDLIGVQNVRYVYEYDGKNETPVSVLSEHLYTKPGQYILLQLSENGGLPLRACIPVWVYDTLPPVVRPTACGTTMSLAITDPLEFPMQYDYMLVRWGDGQVDTVRTGQLNPEHTFADRNPRQIQVQGIHEFGKCGGTTRLSFTPGQPARIKSVDMAGATSVRIQIQNPSGLGLSLQQRTENEAFQGGQSVPPGLLVTVVADVDTSKTTCFRLIPASNCPSSLVNDVSPEVCYMPVPAPVPPTGTTLYFPDAFSPNNDGLNDTFGPFGNRPSGMYQLTIFNRWGQVVFFTDHYGPTWDGLVEGQPAPMGTYAYEVVTELPNGHPEQRNGKLNLLR